jgi:hypothetical protein
MLTYAGGVSAPTRSSLLKDRYGAEGERGGGGVTQGGGANGVPAAGKGECGLEKKTSDRRQSARGEAGGGSRSSSSRGGGGGVTEGGGGSRSSSSRGRGGVEEAFIKREIAILALKDAVDSAVEEERGGRGGGGHAKSAMSKPSASLSGSPGLKVESKSQHTSAYVSIRQHTSACV